MSCDNSCKFRRWELEPNPDIGGIGVLTGFPGTAWLVVFLVTFRYIMAFTPYEDPLHNPEQDETGRRENEWKPNMIDVKVFHMFSKLRKRFAKHENWDLATTKVNSTAVPLM
ncbi:hypothetical protein LX32DRAFT_689051 [Colletotrichum zoysiae]|uniref:Uncharacterized protein n=1 Tax=Colletotrichum zoysiae TaxID=1216348 RepID=A0AAD9M655_9PEZI|nr:hypothetical protein LX32DRAFT_689051 [Colletotrichum zoysiae]